MKRNNFKFYREFWECAKDLRPVESVAFLDAIILYGLYRTKPNLSPELESLFYSECYPILEKDWRKRERKQAKKGAK